MRHLHFLKNLKKIPLIKKRDSIATTVKFDAY